MAGQRRLVDVEELLDVVGGDGERLGGGEPGDGRVQGTRRAAMRSSRPPSLIHRPWGGVPRRPLRPSSSTSGSPSRVNEVARVTSPVSSAVRSMLAIGSVGGQHDDVVGVLADQLDADLDGPLELVPEIGAEPGERRGLACSSRRGRAAPLAMSDFSAARCSGSTSVSG